MFVRTLGIDLASKSARTAVCVVEWRRGLAAIVDIRVRADDELLLDLHGQVDATGIDCPFGWPEPFRRLLNAREQHVSWTEDLRDTLRYRLTDVFVQKATQRWPLSVSSDRIAVPAMRCQVLLHRMGVSDRSGDGRVFEVYPAGSLAVWGLESRGYKRNAGQGARGRLLDDLRQRSPWLDLSSSANEALLAGSDDAFDALVAAISTRAAVLGLSARPPKEAEPVAAREGWIALPQEGSLGLLLAHRE